MGAISGTSCVCVCVCVCVREGKRGRAGAWLPATGER